jgi:23S rRNA pseudouridine1911/1915/1917 synthase
MSQPPREIEIIAENIPLQVIYEDNAIIVIYKEAGMVVHPAYGNYTGTVVNALSYHFQKQGNNEELKPYLVHRIDKDTSGIMMAAKTEIAQTKLAKQFFNHSIERTYHALVWGDFKEDEGIIEGHIGRSLKDRKVMTVFPDGDYGKHAVTHYKVLERFGYVTLIVCRLETGRTHQIRTHLKYIGHPLFNDTTYGGNQILKGTTFTKYKQFVNNCFKMLPRQALHAKSLGFIHPETGQYLEFDSELADDMKQTIEKWRHYSKHKSFEDEDSSEL